MKSFIFIIFIGILTGCSQQKERVVLEQPTRIEVVQPDPRLMEKPEEKQKLYSGVDNGTAAQIIQSNNLICSATEDKLNSLQNYTINLLSSLKSKPTQVLVK